jgi:hypothetical protein
MHIVMGTTKGMQMQRMVSSVVREHVLKNHAVEEEETEQEQEPLAPRDSFDAGRAGPFSPNLRDRVKELERVVVEIMASERKLGGSFEGVKLRPADPPDFQGGKEVMKAWLVRMVQW